jgi:hypothetical protein
VSFATIIDLRGTKVATTSSASRPLNISGLASEVYFVPVENEKQKYHQKASSQ